MVRDLKASSSVAEQLACAHSLLQLNDDSTFKIATQLVADELSLSRGYVELLIEVLVESKQFEFVQVFNQTTGKHDYDLHFVGGSFLEVDEIDLERLNLAEVSQRLADRLKLLSIERESANAAIRQMGRRRKQLQRLEARVNMAHEALERAERSVEVAEGVLASRQATVEKTKAKIHEVTRQRDELRAELG